MDVTQFYYPKQYTSRQQTKKKGEMLKNSKGSSSRLPLPQLAVSLKIDTREDA